MNNHHHELDRILSALSEANAHEFEAARPMPGSVYHSVRVHEREMQNLFRREWMCLGRSCDLAGEGDYVADRVAGVPVLAVRQANGSLKAFLNACAHRFAQIAVEGNGSRRLFVCPYHAWTYDAAGVLVRAPHMEDLENFDESTHGLREIHVEEWQGFVYVSLAPVRPSPLNARLTQLTDEVVGRYDMARYQTVIRDTMPVAANWKNMIENFIESYHVFVVHAATFATDGKMPTDYVCGPDMAWATCHWGTRTGGEGRSIAHASNTALEGDWRRTTVVVCVFPNHLITLAPDYLWSVTVKPDGVGAMQADWSVAVPPEVLGDVGDAGRAAWLAQLRGFMDAANDEDKPVIEALHRGTAMTPGAGRYHPIERNLWNFACYLERMFKSDTEAT